MSNKELLSTVSSLQFESFINLLINLEIGKSLYETCIDWTLIRSGIGEDKKKTLTRRSNSCLRARWVEDQREAGVRSFPADRVVLTHRLPTGSITLSISSSGRCTDHRQSQTLFRSIRRISRASYPRRFSYPSDCSSSLRFQSFVILLYQIKMRLFSILSAKIIRITLK